MVLQNYDPNELASIVEQEYKIKEKMKDNFHENIVKDQIRNVSTNLKNHEKDVAPYFENLAENIDLQASLNDIIEEENDDLMLENKCLYRAIQKKLGSETNSQFDPFKNSLYDQTLEEDQSNNGLDTNIYGNVNKYFENEPETTTYGKKGGRFNTNQKPKAGRNGKAK